MIIEITDCGYIRQYINLEQVCIWAGKKYKYYDEILRKNIYSPEYPKSKIKKLMKLITISISVGDCKADPDDIDGYLEKHNENVYVIWKSYRRKYRL